ncbi:MAG TPA: peroxiredoxin [Candidatus Eisenbacteria bacterium]|nr:peroxiredoxin [Candidatus Eisenbacteria bacterium]
MEATLDRTSTLKVGDKAPDFTLKDQNGNPVSLSDYLGKKNVVVVFHPLAFTSVCDVQMPGYNQERQSFNGLNTQVFAISVDSVPTHRAWAEKLGGIDYPMLADFWPHGEVARTYGVLLDSGVSARATFVVDTQGVIRMIEVHEMGKVPDRQKLIEFLKTLN